MPISPEVKDQEKSTEQSITQITSKIDADRAVWESVGTNDNDVLDTITANKNLPSDFEIPKAITEPKLKTEDNSIPILADEFSNMEAKSPEVKLDAAQSRSSGVSVDGFLNEVAKTLNTSEVHTIVHKTTGYYSLGRENIKQKQASKQWFRKGEATEIHGFKINDGFIYIGNSFEEATWEREPSCIDRTLEVQKSAIEQKRHSIGYYPSYEELTPIQRGVYLEWLANGRNDPEIDIGYVFIYFYGLEKRSLGDAEHNEEAKKDILDIITELERLMTFYSGSRSFSSYANALLDTLRLKYAKESIKFNPRDVSSRNDGVPIGIRYALAKLALEGKPIPADLAMLWYTHSHLNIYYYGPLDTTYDEFYTLFSRRYENKYGAGILVKPNKSKIKLAYRPANRTVRYYDTIVDDLIDITNLTQPLKKLQPIYDQCRDLLSAYGRLVDRKPEEKETIQGLSLLPSELLSGSNHGIVSETKQFANELLKNDLFASVQIKVLFERLSLEAKDKISKAESIAIVQFLSRLFIGIEPDIRFTGHRLVKMDKVILFQIDDKAETTPTENYSFAIFFLELAVSVSESDDQTAEIEKSHLQDWINSIREFSKSEKKRLHAHLEWLFAEKPELSAIKKKIGLLSAEQKEAFLAILIQVANIDGKIEPQEIKMLQKVYGWMGIDKERLFSDMHGYQSESFKHEPVTIFKGDQSKKSYSIPEKADSQSVILNQAKIEKKLKETKKVNKLLSEVFAEEEAIGTPKKVHQEQKIKGLDKLHTDLVMELIQKSKWLRSDFEVLCQTKGLFADGAMEMINEAAYGIADQPLLEDDEEIVVISEVAKAMQLL